jgi:hypothetical protein
MNLSDLKEPFRRDEIEWRIQSAGLKQDGAVWAKIIPYLQARAVMDRFDDVCGPENWYDSYEFKDNGVMCGITIHNENHHVIKWDGAEPTQIESFKGGLSDAFKRAAVKWGVGRYLYSWEVQFADVSMKPQKGWEYATHKAKDGSYTKYWWRVSESAWQDKEPREPTIYNGDVLIDNDFQLPNYADAVGKMKDKLVSRAYLKELHNQVTKKSIPSEEITKHIMTLFGKEKASELTNNEYLQVVKFVRTWKPEINGGKNERC